MCKKSDRFIANKDVMSKKLGGQIVTLNLKTHQYYVLNDTAALIFESCNENTTVEDVSDKLAQAFKASKKRSLEDTMETIDGMIKLGLLNGVEDKREGYNRPSLRAITEEDFKSAVASGAELAARSLLG